MPRETDEKLVRLNFMEARGRKVFSSYPRLLFVSMNTFWSGRARRSRTLRDKLWLMTEISLLPLEVSVDNRIVASVLGVCYPTYDNTAFGVLRSCKQYP
jgi:hypothetical protein